jgi:hypothetical protein
MSAYVCNPTHVALLAVRTAAWTKTWGNAKTVATILAKENLRSVEARYTDITEAAQDFLGMSNAEYIRQCEELAADPNIEFHTLPMHRIFGMANCLEYQSCEAEDYRSTEAAAIVNFLMLKAARINFEVQKLEPGWEFDPSQIKTRNLVRLF